MAYKANGVGTKRQGETGNSSSRARVTVDGIEFSPKRRLYPGKPSPAILASNVVNVMTLEGRAWPGSYSDRLAASAPDRAPRATPDGKSIRLAGPNAMRDEQAAGLWPTERERELQAHAEAKLANPEEYARRSLIAQGYSAEKAAAMAKANSTRRQLIDVSDLLPGAQPEKPRGDSQRKAS